MTHDELAQMVRTDLAEVLGVELDEVSYDSALADFDTDSADLVEVIGLAESRLGITIEDEGLYDIKRVDQLIALVEGGLSALGHSD